MPQVAARINEEQERWLKDYFRTKSAGAEFILPWAVDTFFRGISNVKSIFTPAELKTIVDAHKDVKIDPDNTRPSYLAVRILDACDRNKINAAHGASKSSLELKLRTLDDTQAAALTVWACAYWVSRNCTAATLDDYIKQY
ncbi:MAG: hypothetical protein IKT16_05640 [Desulfovibrio sp.]|jgi:hypothetical protein|nr:hypothetical protein [Desulfovibrio sp.]MBR4746446.1 hypothetical protein [Desulfovibrio sp.]MBR5051040.1 hypothetical protein [Desulfovibrio sp.]MBR6467617.1 hypothetical protein [Desulfovibrio sp.]